MIGRSAVRTDTGRKRRRNEDAYVCEPPLFAIADGMGGAQAGEVASGLAAAVLARGARGDERGEERVVALIQEANRRVYQRSSEDAAASGMGTTMTVALVDADAGTIALGHVGDSRAYRVRDGELEQLTDDHSLVGELVRSGKLSPRGGGGAPAALGDHARARHRAGRRRRHVHGPSRARRRLPALLGRADDMVSDGEILAARRGSATTSTRAARALVEAANAGGGEDNITVVLFQLDGDGERRPSRPAAPVEPTTTRTRSRGSTRSRPSTRP